MKLTVRDTVTQIKNNTSKCDASIQSRTALNAGETENLVTDQLEAVQQTEHRDTRDLLDTGTSSRRRWQYQEGQEARECCNNVQNKSNRCFCTTILFKSQDWYSARSSIPHSNRNRNRNRQLSVNVNIESDAQTEWIQETVNKFETLLTRNGSWQ